VALQTNVCHAVQKKKKKGKKRKEEKDREKPGRFNQAETKDGKNELSDMNSFFTGGMKM